MRSGFSIFTASNMKDESKRPWGHYDILLESDTIKVKKIVVKPGKRLSYQSHKFRSENWVIAQGIATVTLDDIVYELKQNDHIYIPQGSKHRVANEGDLNLVFIEVQSGSYFGEDDITRYEDDFNRV